MCARRGAAIRLSKQHTALDRLRKMVPKIAAGFMPINEALTLEKPRYLRTLFLILQKYASFEIAPI